MSPTRRDFIAGGVGVGLGALMASCGSKNVGTLLGPDLARADASVVPWEYTALDPKVTAARAYDIYWQRACMTAPFEAVVGLLGEMHGEPYTQFPFEMLKYGGGGISVSTVCGTVNGSAMAFGLFVADGGDRSALVSDLIHWYEQTELPTYVPDTPHNDVEVPLSIAGSNLCHVSVSNWTKVSGASEGTPERAERCARLCASMAEKLTTMLNAYFAGTFVPASPLSSEAQTCRGCHDKGGMVGNTRANMECMACHVPHDL